MKSIKDPPQPVNLGRYLMALADWEPYRPEGYPITDKFHNPWVVIDPISGQCAFDVWTRMGRTADESALRAELDKLTATK